MREIALIPSQVELLPVLLDDIKDDLRIAHTDLDHRLIEYLRAVVNRAENFMKRAIVNRTHVWIVDEFPYGDDQTIFLPRGTVTAVAKIEYEVNGSITTLLGPTSGSPAGTGYREDLRGDRARLLPPRGGTWPSADTDSTAPVVVTFTAGWQLADVPDEVKRALTVGVAEALDGQGDPERVEKILSPYRLAS